MLTQQDTKRAITGLRSIARKSGEVEGDIDEALAENLGIQKDVIERIALGEATKADYLAAAAALEKLAESVEEPEDTATKSAFGGATTEGLGDHDGRDALGRRIYKDLGSSPGEARERQIGELQAALKDRDGDDRDALGRSRRKVYG